MEVLRSLDNVVQIIVLLAVVVVAFLSLDKCKHPVPMAFFAFGMLTYLVSDIYWIVHLLMKGGSRLPFTAAEIGDFGLFLLLAASLKAVFEDDPSHAPMGLTVAACLFSAANIALWTAWNGEWFRNLLGGIAVGYYYWRVARDMWETNVLSRREWLGLLAGCAMVVGLLTVWTVIGQPWKDRVEIFCYVLLFAGVVWFYAKTVLALKRGLSRVAVSLAFGTLGWSFCALYMCGEPSYFAADTAITLTTPLMLLALRREASGA